MCWSAKHTEVQADQRKPIFVRMMWMGNWLLEKWEFSAFPIIHLTHKVEFLSGQFPSSSFHSVSIERTRLCCHQWGSCYPRGPVGQKTQGERGETLWIASLLARLMFFKSPESSSLWRTWTYTKCLKEPLTVLVLHSKVGLIVTSSS